MSKVCHKTGIILFPFKISTSSAQTNSRGTQIDAHYSRCNSVPDISVCSHPHPSHAYQTITLSLISSLANLFTTNHVMSSPLSKAKYLDTILHLLFAIVKSVTRLLLKVSFFVLGVSIRFNTVLSIRLMHSMRIHSTM